MLFSLDAEEVLKPGYFNNFHGKSFVISELFESVFARGQF